MTKVIGVQKGTKRGTYARSARKREIRDEIQEDGMSYSEIAAVLKISVGEVKEIERSAFRKLKKPTVKNKDLFDYHSIKLEPYGAVEG